MRVVSLSCSSFLSLFSAALVLLAAPFSVPAQSYEEVGYFCATCTTDSKARQVALGSVPRPECDWDPHAVDNGDTDSSNDQERIDSGRAPWPDRDELSGDLPQCRAPLRRVVIANHITNQLFSYLVGWNQDQWQYVILQQVQLNSDEADAYRRLIDFRLHWESILNEPLSLANVYSGNSAISTRGAGGGCPDGTALDYVLDPSLETQAKQQMRQHVSENLSDFQDNEPWVRGGTLGLIFRRIPVTLNLAPPDQSSLNSIALEGPLNEYGEPGDVLLYHVELASVTTGGQAIVNFELLTEYSWVLSAPLDDVLSGNFDVEDNPCVRDKLATLAQNDGEGEWRNSGGQRIDQSALRGPSLPPGPRCYVYFYQGGTLLYVFRVDCNRAE